MGDSEREDQVQQVARASATNVSNLKHTVSFTVVGMKTSTDMPSVPISRFPARHDQRMQPIWVKASHDSHPVRLIHGIVRHTFGFALQLQTSRLF